MKNRQLVLIIPLLLSSCTLTSLPSNVRKTIDQESQSIAQANKRIDQVKNHPNLENYVTHSSVGYFGNQAVSENNGDFLPPSFNDNIQMDRVFTDIRAMINTLTDLTDIPTVLDLTNTANDQSCTNIRITQTSGDLVNLLDLITTKCDLGWDYRDGKIVVFDMETKTWSIRGIPGDVEVNSQIQNNAGATAQTGTSGGLTIGASGGGGGAASNSQNQTEQSATQNTAYNLSNNLWANLQDAIKMQLSKDGKVSISPATSTLTVTDKPSVIDRVDHYITIQNNKLKKMVIIDVELISVDVNAEDNYGINWNTILGNKNSNAQFLINGAAGTSATTGTQTSNNVFTPTTTTQSFTFTMNQGSLTGLSFLINALSTNAKSSVVTSTAVSTLSSQPVPLQFVDQQAYLASIANTSIALGSNQISLTPGQLTTGFSLNLLPVVENDNKVDLQISINLSALKQMSQYSSNGSSIQLPSTIQRNFMQKVVITSGSTFVMTGFDSDTKQILNTGVGSPTNWWLGGGVSASKHHTRLVMLVTPTVVNL